MTFLDQYLFEIQRGMLFKIKKFLLPTLLSVAKHISYDKFLQNVYHTFVKFTQDEIWGVRKVCLERLQDFIKLINSNDIPKITQCV